MATEKVAFTEEKETLLGTLYGRALDARADQPILGDPMAAETVEKIDYDFARLRVTPNIASSVAVRAKDLDRWTREFLSAHAEATVVHLGCGLDTRVWRIDPGPGVHWFDVDFPEVIALRERLYPQRANYTQLGSSVTDPRWLAQVPADRPVLVVAEGLTMYLKPADARALLQRITDRFEHGALLFDVFNTLGIRLQKLNPVVRRSGSKLYWGVDDPQQLVRWNPRLRLVEAPGAMESPAVRELPRQYGLIAAVMRIAPPLRYLGRYLRYEF